MEKILITGAAGGIARNTINLLKKDYFIYVTVHTSAQLKTVEKRYKNYYNIKCFKLDVTDNNDLKKIKDLDIDILICNSAAGESGSICEIDVNKIKKNFDVNVFSNIKLIQVVLKNMINKNKGKIIIMSSLAGVIPIPFLGSYCATKASLIKLAECLNMELKLINKNIKIVLIEPGLYNTGFNEYMLGKKNDFMEDISYFKKDISTIKKIEKLVLLLFQKNKLYSISNKIVKAIKSDKPKFIYYAPFSQMITSKLYVLINTIIH